MTDINPKDFIDELRFDIKVNDLIKARLVMVHFDEIDAQTQKAALQELAGGTSKFVIPLLVNLLADNPQTGETYPDIKELLYSKALDEPTTLATLLIREAKPANRAVMAEVAGEIRLQSATPILLSILEEELDTKALRGAISALGMIGDPTATTPISEFLYSGDLDLILTAIQALGQLGTPTAIQRLAEKLGSDKDLDFMILNVFAYSQEPEAIEKLNAALSAQMAHLRNAGKQHLADLGRKAVPVLINNLRYNDPDLLIHTLNILGDIGDESAISPIRKLLHNEPRDPNVRFAAYEALGKLPVAKGAFALAQGLDDPVGNVRAAAAKAIDHNYNTVLAAGIKNMIRDEDCAQRPISRTIIDAQCETIFLDLIQEDHFCGFAVEYLTHRAHADLRDHFAGLLRKNGSPQIAACLDEQADTQAEAALKVFAVDDSKMILNIYRSVLHNLGCDPVLFEFPAKAIEAAREIKPDLIFTDLNMPDISGVELTAEIRNLYSKAQLPIIMVTTQNECQDNEAARAAGVNAILHKPFNEDTLRRVMEKHLASGAE